MNSPWIKILYAAEAIVSCLLVSACDLPAAPTVSCRRPVEGMAGLTAGLEVPPHFRQTDATKTGEEFDPNRYFTVLDHLSLEPGYTLDYVYYYDGMGGLPILYARPVDQPPYPTYSAYAAAQEGKETPDSYLDHVRIDGTEEGFFQFVALRLMGSQFYLFWHANYNDSRIVCDSAALEAILSADGAFGLEIPDPVKEEARRLSLAPTVEIRDEVAVVRVIAFTKWGGFIRHTYTISRTFPHRIQEEDSETLVPYNCGIMF